MYPVLALAIAAPSAQTATQADVFVGVYQYAESPSTEAAREAAIDVATEELNLMIRPFTRAEIHEKNVATRSVTIRYEKGNLVIETPRLAWSTDSSTRRPNRSCLKGNQGI